MPIKTFTQGEVLTSSDVNTYLMRQAVITCTSSTRPASPVEGMTIYQTDTDNTWVYDGATWMPNTPMQPMKPTSVTNGTATGNLVTFTNVASVTINGVFNANYSTYRIMYSVGTGTFGTTAYLVGQLCASGVAATTSYVGKSLWNDTGTANQTFQNYDWRVTGYSLGAIGSSDNRGMSSFDLDGPYEARYSNYSGNFVGTYNGVANYMGINGGAHQSLSLYDGIRFLANTGNITGTVRVYGYR